MAKKIIILGAGIGGLTVAHELINCNKKKYDIHIYERNNIIGGMARSAYKERNGIKLPTEYCWRIYGPNYGNLRKILKQIPLKNNPSKTVHDNLVDISDFLIADKNTIFKMNNRPKTLLDIRRAFKKIPFREKLSVFKKVLYCFMISTARLNSMDNMSWKNYIDPHNSLSHDMRKYIIDIMGPYLGAEAALVNVPSVAKTLESFKIFNRPNSVMNGPTNEAWFDHWQAYLESKDVTFHLNSTIVDVRREGDTVTCAILNDGVQVVGDAFFCGMPVESVSKISSLKIPGIVELAKRSHQLMVSIQLYFDKKIFLENENTAMHIPDSPWQLVIEPQGSIWKKSYGDIADLWSVGLCDPLRLGLFIKKPFIECSHEEIKTEVWYQIINSELGSYLQLENIRVLDYNVWDTYVYNGHTIETVEPKFSTNQGTYYFRPDNKTDLKNFYFSTAYTKTETDMFEMESAAESGRRAAQLLENKIKVIVYSRPLFFSFYQWLDSYFPKLNLHKKVCFSFFMLMIPALVIIPFAFIFRVLKNIQ